MRNDRRTARGMADRDTGRSRPHREADRMLLRMLRHSAGWAGMLAGCAVVAAVAGTVLPAAVGRALDALLRGEAAAGWLAVCAALVAVFVACEAAGDLARGNSTATATAWLRRVLLGHVLAAGPRATRRFPAGDVVSRIVGNAAEAGNAPAAAAMLLASAVPVVGSLVALLLIDPWLAVAFVSGLPAVAALARIFVRDTSNAVTRYLRTQGTIAARLVDALAGARTIAAANTVDKETERVLTPLAELSRHGHGMWRALARATGQSALVVPLLQIVVLAVAGLRLAAGHLTPGEMLAASQYAVLGMSIGSVVGALNGLARARAGAGRAAELTAEPPPAYGTARLPPGGRGRLEFRGVTASPGGVQSGPGGVQSGPSGVRVLDGLDLVVPGGTAVAVVGRSGVGKSLLAALAGRLADPDQGDVLLDGVPLRDLDRAELRDAVGYAFERPALIGRTLDDVIGFGRRMPAEEQVRRAARAACVDDFIRRLPEGYRTPLDDTPMSGGEAQRLGLARTFAHAGRLLVLDDATSSLDTATELQVGNALTGEFGDRTRLIVAHRAATAARADLVVWLDEGRVRARGHHHGLWHDPAYRAIFHAGTDTDTEDTEDTPAGVPTGVPTTDALVASGGGA